MIAKQKKPVEKASKPKQLKPKSLIELAAACGAEIPQKPAATVQPDQPTMSVKQRLNLIGIEAICERIEGGETYRDIAASIKINSASLSNWLNTPENIKQSARAREESAEAWLDRGLDTIATALPKDGGIDASAARAYAQECARRAAIRNSRYSDKIAVGGAADLPPIQTESISDTDLARQLAAILSGALAKAQKDAQGDDNG